MSKRIYFKSERGKRTSKTIEDNWYKLPKFSKEAIRKTDLIYLSDQGFKKVSDTALPLPLSVYGAYCVLREKEPVKHITPNNMRDKAKVALLNLILQSRNYDNLDLLVGQAVDTIVNAAMIECADLLQNKMGVCP